VNRVPSPRAPAPTGLFPHVAHLLQHCWRRRDIESPAELVETTPWGRRWEVTLTLKIPTI